MADSPDSNKPKFKLPAELAKPPKLPPDIFSRAIIPSNPLVSATQANHASEFHNRLMKLVKDFDESLDKAHEVGVRLVSFGQTVIFALEDMGYWNPSLIIFHGHTGEGGPVELIQHVSQISLMLMRLPRQNPEKPKKPIGFQVAPDDAALAEET